MITDASVVERRRSIEILAALASQDRHVRELQRIIGGSASTIDARVRELVLAGYVRESSQPRWPFRRTLSLTEQGRAAAHLAYELKGLFGEPPESRRQPTLDPRQRFLLALVEGLGGHIYGSTRLQKYAFLAQHRGGVPAGRSYSFTPNKFGPFSGQILDDVRKLARCGFLKVELEVFEPSSTDGDLLVRRNYVLTTSGRRQGLLSAKSLSVRSRSAIETLKDLDDFSTDALVSYVHHEYPEESGLAPKEPKRRGPE